MLKNNKLLIITIIFFILCMFIPKIALAAGPIDNPDYFDPTSSVSKDDADAVTKKLKPIINTIATIGLVVSVITMMILGIKYMVGSASEKAEYKKTMIPYIIGVVFLVSISGILGLILTLTNDVASAIK